jgi:peptide/nickel transport system substrate-binding protein
MLHRRSMEWIVAGVLACVALAGPSAAEEPRQGGHLIVANESEFGELDPHITCATSTARWVMNHIAEPLVQQDMTDTETIPPPLVPGLAQTWDISEDGKDYTFHLMKGVKFHDGTDFTAQDVQWNVYREFDQTKVGRENAPQFYDAAAAAAEWRWNIAGLDNVEVVDDYTVVFHLKHAFNPLLRMLAQTDCGPLGIISPESVEEYGNEGVQDHVIGTGPFKMVERVPGDRFVMDRFDDYWKKEWLPYLDRVTIVVMPDTAARQAALQAGEVDVIIAPEPDSLENLKSKGFVVEQGPMPHIWTLSFNEQEKAFEDKRVRLAVQHAIDRKGMAEQLLAGTALPGESWLSRTSDAFEPTDRWYEYDPEKAKALLEEANAVGTKLVLATSTSGSGQMQPAKMAEWIQRNLNAVGFDTDIELMEWNAYLAKFFEGFDPKWSLVQMSWGWTGAYWLDMFLNPANQPPGQKDIGVADKLAAAHQMTDPAAARAAYREVAEMVKDSAWFMPVVNDTAPIVMRPCVHDYPHVSDWQTGFVARVWLSCED